MSIKIPLKKHQPIVDDSDDEEEEEDDSLDEEDLPVPQPNTNRLQRVPSNRTEPEHFAGSSKVELVRLADGSLREVTRVWASENESAVSTDPLLILIAKRLFKEMGA